MELLDACDQTLHVVDGIGHMAIGIRDRGQKAQGATSVGTKAVGIARGGVIRQRDRKRPVQDVIGGHSRCHRIEGRIEGLFVARARGLGGRIPAINRASEGIEGEIPGDDEVIGAAACGIGGDGRGLLRLDDAFQAVCEKYRVDGVAGAVA